MEILKEQISKKIEELEMMIKEDYEKNVIEIKRKELDKLLKQYIKEIWSKIQI